MKSPHEDRSLADPHLIAAYLDGELDGQPELVCLRQRIQEWLLDHPDAGRAALAQRRLGLLLRATHAPEPSEAVWDGVLARIHDTPVPPPSTRRVGAIGRRLSLVVAVLGSAAAVWLALVWWPRPQVPEIPALAVHVPHEAAPVQDPPAEQTPLPPAGDRPRAKGPKWEPFEVATADEVEIMRIGGADVKTLVVGNAPVKGALLPPNPGEVVLSRAEPEVRMEKGATPIFWLQAAADKGP